MNYWEVCIGEAFDDCGVQATIEQIKDVAEWCECAEEIHDTVTGMDVVCANHKTEAQIELEELKVEIELKEKYERSTIPCPVCATAGFVKDGWDRSKVCDKCNGKGRL